MIPVITKTTILSRELSNFSNCNSIARFPIRHLEDLKGLSIRALCRNRVRASQVWDFGATGEEFTSTRQNRHCKREERRLTAALVALHGKHHTKTCLTREAVPSYRIFQQRPRRLRARPFGTRRDDKNGELDSISA